MDDQIYDIIIIGLGAMGSSAFYQASQQNNKVLGLEQFTSPNIFGSTHGETRITRTAYFEDPLYVPLALKSQKMIKQLEKETNQSLFYQNGILNIGDMKKDFMKGVIRSVKEHSLPSILLSGKQLKEKYKQLNFPDNFEALFENNAGALFPEKIIKTYIEQGLKSKNSKIHFGTRVLSYKEIRQDQDSNNNQKLKQPYNIIVETDNGTFKSKQIIISAGMWNKKLLSDLNIPFTIQKNHLVWYECQNEQFKPENMPIFLSDIGTGMEFYGFPDFGTGVKVSLHYGGGFYDDPDKVNRDFDQNLVKNVTQTVKSYLNLSKDPKIIRVATCFYTILPDTHFLLDFHPSSKNIVMMSPCSGHGFKFSPILGLEAVKMLESGQIKYPEFNYRRLLNQQPKL